MTDTMVTSWPAFSLGRKSRLKHTLSPPYKSQNHRLFQSPFSNSYVFLRILLPIPNLNTRLHSFIPNLPTQHSPFLHRWLFISTRNTHVHYRHHKSPSPLRSSPHRHNLFPKRF